MFLRSTKKSVNGRTYRYWMIADTRRTGKVVAQKVVAYLGSLSGMSRRDVASRLIEAARKLHPGAAGRIESVSWRRVRSYGDVCACLAAWDRLGLRAMLDALLAPEAPRHRPSVPTCRDARSRCANGTGDLGRLAAIAVMYAVCCRDNRTSLPEWYAGTALPDLLGLDAGLVYETGVRRALRRLVQVERRLEECLAARVSALLPDTPRVRYRAVFGCARGRTCTPNSGGFKRGVSALLMDAHGFPVSLRGSYGRCADWRTWKDAGPGTARARTILVAEQGVLPREALRRLRRERRPYIVAMPAHRLPRVAAAVAATEWHSLNGDVRVEKDQATGERRFVWRTGSPHIRPEICMAATNSGDVCDEDVWRAHLALNRALEIVHAPVFASAPGRASPVLGKDDRIRWLVAALAYLLVTWLEHEYRSRGGALPIHRVFEELRAMRVAHVVIETDDGAHTAVPLLGPMTEAQTEIQRVLDLPRPTGLCTQRHEGHPASGL